MRASFRTFSTQALLVLALVSGCAEAALTSELEDFEGFDAAVTLPQGDAAPSADDDAASWVDAAWPGVDSGVPWDGSEATPDAATADGGATDAEASDAEAPDASTPDAAAHEDASVADAGPADAGALDAGPDASTADASVPDAGPADAGRPDASQPDAGGSCSPQTCTNDCSIGAPFKCCKSNGTCGCSWFSVAYCS